MFYTILASIIFCAVILAISVKMHKSYIETKIYHAVKMEAIKLERENLLTSKETLTRLIEQIEEINLTRQRGDCNDADKKKCEICTLACVKEEINLQQINS